MAADKNIARTGYEKVHQLNRELRQNIKQLMAIQETSKAILSVLDLDQLLSVIMDILADVCRINRGVIMRVNKDEGHLEYLHGVGFGGQIPDEIRKYRVPLCQVDDIVSRAASTGKSEYIPLTDRSGPVQGNGGRVAPPPRSVFVVPLIARSKVTGVIAVDAVDADGVPEKTRNTLELFAPQIAIAIQNATMYSKLQEQMLALKKSHALLKRAEKLSFIGNLAARLAHEIKNPMTAIATFMQMLPEKYDDDAFRNDFYAVAMEETHRINNLITELLDLARPRESHFEPVDLHTLINQMTLLVSARSKAKTIRITRRFDDTIGRVDMDEEKIKQALLNVISNAVSFTPERGNITIETAKLSESGRSGVIRVQVKDSGPGIDPLILDKIFDPYFTTKHRSDIYSGTGLGLFIALQNMQDHGGDIEVDRCRCKGAMFILTLPYPCRGNRT